MLVQLRLARRDAYLERLSRSAGDWAPDVRRLRPDMPWQDVLSVVNSRLPESRRWTLQRLVTPRPMSPKGCCQNPPWNGRRDGGRTTAFRYWLPRCVRHVRTSPCRKCATCSRRCMSRRPADVRRGIRPVSRRSSNERRDWELRLSGRRRSLSAAAIRMPCPVRQADECRDRGGIGSRFVGRRLTRVSGSRDASWHRTSTHEHQNAPYERRGIRRRLSTCAFEEGRLLRHLRSHS